jgi:hypothetical protein
MTLMRANPFRGQLEGVGPESRDFFAVFRIRIRIHMFLGLPDPDQLVRGMDPDPSITKQK